MANKFIDARKSVNGKRGHLNMGNPFDMVTLLASIAPSSPILAPLPYTFLNALTSNGLSPATVKWGGELVNNTTVFGKNDYDVTFQEIVLFTTNSTTNIFKASNSNLVRTINSPASDECSFKVETDAFIFGSTDSVGTNVFYELPSNDEPDLGDVMVMNTDNKAVFVAMERDVTLEVFDNLTAPTSKYFYIPFNSGKWSLKRITVFSDNVVNSDEIHVSIQNAAGTPLTLSGQVTMSDRNAGYGIGFTEALLLTHPSAPQVYRFSFDIVNTGASYVKTYVTLTFTKSF